MPKVRSRGEEKKTRGGEGEGGGHSFYPVHLTILIHWWYNFRSKCPSAKYSPRSIGLCLCLSFVLHFFLSALEWERKRKKTHKLSPSFQLSPSPSPSLFSFLPQTYIHNFSLSFLFLLFPLPLPSLILPALFLCLSESRGRRSCCGFPSWLP